MPFNTTTGVYTRVSNSFSQPVLGTEIDPGDADLFFDDLDTSLSLLFGTFGTVSSTSLASATTTNLGATATFKVFITGTTTITSFGTVANRLRIVTFEGALTLTANPTALILPAGSNITTAANDTAIFMSDGSGNWTCIAYKRQAGGLPTTLNVSGGGTGLTSGTSGGIPFFDSTNTMASSAALAAGLVVIGGGAGVTPATIANGQLPATATNDSASAGKLGEFNSATVVTGSAVSLSTGVTANVTSMSLTAGDWDVSGIVYIKAAATTTVNIGFATISTTSATLDTNPGFLGTISLFNNTGTSFGTDPALYAPPKRISVSGTTTVYLPTQITFGVSTCAAYGHIRARRVR